MCVDFYGSMSRDDIDSSMRILSIAPQTSRKFPINNCPFRQYWKNPSGGAQIFRAFYFKTPLSQMLATPLMPYTCRLKTRVSREHIPHTVCGLPDTCRHWRLGSIKIFPCITKSHRMHTDRSQRKSYKVNISLFLHCFLLVF